MQIATKILIAAEDYLKAMLMMKEKHGYIRSRLLEISENDENRVVRIHAAGAARAIDKGAC